MSLRVQNIPEHVEEAELQSLLEGFPGLVAVRLVRNRTTGTSRGQVRCPKMRLRLVYTVYLHLILHLRTIRGQVRCRAWPGGRGAVGWPVGWNSRVPCVRRGGWAVPLTRLSWWGCCGGRGRGCRGLLTRRCGRGRGRGP
jgi:hypothetical protein